MCILRPLGPHRPFSRRFMQDFLADAFSGSFLVSVTLLSIVGQDKTGPCSPPDTSPAPCKASRSREAPAGYVEACSLSITGVSLEYH